MLNNPENKTKIKYYILSSLIFIAAVSFRFIKLGSQSMYIDEGASWYLSSFPVCSIVKIILNINEVHPPFYFYFLHYWMEFFGQSEFVLRLPSVIFGSLCLILICRITKKFYDINVSLWAIFLLSFSEFFINYNQEVRMYSMLSFFTLLSSYYFLKLIKEDCKLVYAIIYAISTVCCFYTHYLSFFAFLSQIIFFFIFYNDHKKKSVFIAWTILIPVFLFLPWIKYLFIQLSSQNFLIRPKPGFSSLYNLIYNITYSEFTGMDNTNILGLSVMFIAALIPVYMLYKSVINKENKYNYFWILYFFLPLILIFGLSNFTKLRIFEYKYFIIFLPGYFILCASSLSKLKSRYLTIPIASVFLMLNFTGYYNRTYEPDYRNQDWRNVSKIINTFSTKNDLVLITPSMMYMPFSYYNRSHAEILPFDIFSDRKIIMEKIKGKSVLWLAYPPNYPLNYDLELEKFLNRHCSINKMFLSKRAIPANVLKLTVYENIFK